MKKLLSLKLKNTMLIKKTCISFMLTCNEAGSKFINECYKKINSNLHVQLLYQPYQNSTTGNFTAAVVRLERVL